MGQLLGQVVLTGGPVLLAAAGGAPAEVTALFAGLALFRAPYTLALGLVSQLTERLTGAGGPGPARGAAEVPHRGGADDAGRRRSWRRSSAPGPVRR